MTPAVVFAALAGGLAVAGAWEALAAVQEAAPARALGRLFAPVRAVAREGREPSAGERLRLALVGAATLLAAGWLVAGPLTGAVLACVTPWLVRRFLVARRRRWRAALAAGAPTVARALADALASGHSVRGAVAAVAAGGGLGSAAGTEMRACAAALDLGETTAQALERLRERAGHPAYDTIAAVLVLHGTTGGPLATMLAELATHLEEADRVEADARAATAQARYTAGVVAALPAGAVALAELGSPGTVGSIVTSPLPAALALAGILCQAVALGAVARMSRVGAR